MDQTFLDKYNPANAAKLTPEEIEAMREFSNDELKALAERYRNGPTGNNYLVLFDKRIPPEKQLAPLTTWQNLYNLRKNTKQTNFYALTFASLYNKKDKVKTAPGIKVAAPVDLSKKDLKAAPGVKEVKDPGIKADPALSDTAYQPPVDTVASDTPADTSGEVTQTKPDFAKMDFPTLKKAYKELTGHDVPATINNKVALVKALDELIK